MTERTTRDVILDAARPLFAERGFNGTTIRDVAEAAGVSPALVMKLTGSKAELFQAAAPDSPGLAEATRHDEPVGYRMVRAVVERRDSDDYDFWAMAPFLIREAADPAVARARTNERVVARIAALIGDESAGLVRSQMVVTLLLGLAGSLRTFELLPPDEMPGEALIETYGRLVQSVVDDPGL